MGYRSWLQNYVNNHPDQNTRSQGQALLNSVGDDMGIDRNFLSGNVGNGGNYRKTGWFGRNTWVKGGDGKLYKNDEISGINDRFKQMYYADQRGSGGGGGGQQGGNLNLGYYGGGGGGGWGGGNRASAAQLAEYDQGIGQLEHGLGRIDTQLGVRLGNINNQYNTKKNELRSSWNRAEGRFNDQTRQNQ